MSSSILKNKEKLVSVIITTYNRPFYMLNKAIKSVLLQTYKNIEVIVVDDNDENMRKELEIEKNIKVYKKIKYIKNKKNMGPCIARNRGIEESRGEYIAFLDDDDEWDENKIFLQVNELLNCNESFGMVNVGYYRVNDDNDSINTIYPPKIKGNGLDFFLEKGNYIIYPLIKRECFNKVGTFNKDLHHSEDYEMWLRILKEYNITFVNKPLAYYHFHNNENRTYNYKDFIFTSKQIENLHKEIFINNKAARWNMYTSRAKAYMYIKDYKLALSSFMIAIKNKPLKIAQNIKNLLHLSLILMKKH